ncbi:acyl carrier protein [Butyrivibrio fibrisolvens DSM 3071]|uniref:Acyl carrier protein n=1 Tax=Butyrivibrio fibrisolvens DSM 3071 TaxID=1121131 RepID=A0A1M5W6Y2_BUTFI|nr:acyl carrier protein [Butyrivibrio fibrisolvens]SHH83225.1 acyl carrier protein [Butyrivibrio fibrisolvens DSM 3071]
MLDEFKKLMKEQYDIDNIELSSNFKTDFDLSSFDFIELICLVEERYGIEMDEDDYKSLNTVEDMITYIQEKIV